jgi:hypothetical protein
MDKNTTYIMSGVLGLAIAYAGYKIYKDKKKL